MLPTTISNEQTIIRAAIYARVSGDDTKQEGRNLQGQIDLCREYARQRGYNVVDVFAEDAFKYTGGADMDLPELSRMLDTIATRSFDVLIVRELDRLARLRLKQLWIEDVLEKKGIRIEYVIGQFENTDEGRLQKGVMSEIAEYERKKIRRRMENGKILKAKSGKWMGTTPPYGYRKIGERSDSHLEINWEEANIVKRIYAMYTGTDGYAPHDMLGIAVKLTAEKIPVSGRGRKSARGWTDGTIGYILSNTAYIGQFVWGKEIMPFPELALIDPDIFEATQKRKIQNTKLATRNRKHDYLLAGGYFRCSCGCSMVGRTVYSYSKYGSPKKYFYYICCNQRRRYLYDNCEENTVNSDVVDQIVWEWLKELLSDDNNLKNGIESMIANQELEFTPTVTKIQQLQELLIQTQSKVARLATAYAEASNDIVAGALKIELNKAGRDQAMIQDEIKRLQAKLDLNKITPEEIELIKQIARQLRTELHNADFETKRLLVDKIDLHVKLTKNESGRALSISCRLIPSDVVLSIVPTSLKPVTTLEPCRNY